MRQVEGHSIEISKGEPVREELEKTIDLDIEDLSSSLHDRLRACVTSDREALYSIWPECEYKPTL